MDDIIRDMGFRSLLVSFVLSVSIVFSAHGFYQDPDAILLSLGLNNKPDVRKMNVSQEEFSKKMNMYLRRTRRSTDARRLFSIRPEEVERRESGDELLKFRTEWGEVEGVTLKMLVVGASYINVYQRYNDTNESQINAKELSQSGAPIWVDSHIVPPVNINENSTLLDVRVSCGPTCQVVDSTLNVIVRTGNGRSRRHTAITPTGLTDCVSGSQKKRCCRHKMDVVFKQLPGYEFIVAPFSFDAGFCRGGCPYRFNPANHHASIQSLMNRRRLGGAPKPCCAPSKLDHLEILHLDENNPQNLKLTKWDNMKVVECACS